MTATGDGAALASSPADGPQDGLAEATAPATGYSHVASDFWVIVEDGALSVVRQPSGAGQDGVSGVFAGPFPSEYQARKFITEIEGD